MTPAPRTAAGNHPRHTAADGLWAMVPREVGARFRPRAEPMARAILQEIQRAVPEYARPLEGEFGKIITKAIREAVVRCIDCIGAPGEPPEGWATVFRRLGEVEFAHGRSLDCLQTAYRVGGRVAWRHVAEFGRDTGVSAETLCTCAEAIFAYMDEISTLSIEGYTAAQSSATGALALRRRRLLELMLADPPSAPRTIAAQAAAAEWALPAEITVVALEPRAGRPGPAIADLPSEMLADLTGSEPCLVTGKPDRHLDGLAARLGGWRAAVGPAARLADVPRSLFWARRTLRLVQRGILRDAPVTRATDHLSTLWLLSDEFLLRELCSRSLAPLQGLTPKQRARLSETLLTWLQSRGSAPEIAKRLQVHPQTVRYRMHQLTQLFGDRLNDANQRLDMEIALRAEGLSSPGGSTKPS